MNGLVSIKYGEYPYAETVQTSVSPPQIFAAIAIAGVRCVLPPQGIVKVRTGIAVELPENTSGIIWGKSSVESKGIKAMAGLVDAPYRGELLVCMYNLNEHEFVFEAGQKIAQLVVLPTLYPTFEEAAELSDTSRGAGGFGSTGK